MVWILFLACNSETKEVESLICEDTGIEEGSVQDTSVEDTAEEIVPEDTQWDDAILEILSPQSGFVPLGESVEFEARVRSPDGSNLDFQDISWSTDQDPAWTGTGTNFTDDTLPAGLHTLSTFAELPNGDRLGYAIGGLLVQHPDAGIYAGTTSIISNFTSFDGTPIIVTCAGAVTITVNMEGDYASGSSTCIMNILGSDQETFYDFEIDVDNGVLSGVAIADLFIIGWDFELEGTIGSGQLSATWSDDVFGLGQIDGSMDLERVSLY